MAQQSFALDLSGAQTARHRPGQRDLDQLQQHERADRDGRELGPQLAADRGDTAVAEVGLVQHRLARRGVQLLIDLEQLRLGLELVLVGPEIAHLGVRLAGLEDLELVGLEFELLSDEARLVGVEDHTVLRPQLHPHQRASEHRVAHRPVEVLERVAVLLQETGVEQWLDDALAGRVGDALRIGDGLVGADAPTGERRERADQGKDDHPGDGEPADEARDGDRLLQIESFGLTTSATAHPCMLAPRPGGSQRPAREWAVRSIPTRCTPATLVGPGSRAPVADGPSTRSGAGSTGLS